MNRSFLGISVSVVILLATPAAKAQAQASDDAVTPFAQEIVAQLRVMGYDSFTIRRTLLGRIRIYAELPDADSREIIVNPRTGEILRDHIEADGEDRLIAHEQPGLFRPGDYQNDDWDVREPTLDTVASPQSERWP